MEYTEFGITPRSILSQTDRNTNERSQPIETHRLTLITPLTVKYDETPQRNHCLHLSSQREANQREIRDRVNIKLESRNGTCGLGDLAAANFNLVRHSYRPAYLFRPDSGSPHAIAWENWKCTRLACQPRTGGTASAWGQWVDRLPCASQCEPRRHPLARQAARFRLFGTPGVIVFPVGVQGVDTKSGPLQRPTARLVECVSSAFSWILWLLPCE